MAAGKSVTDMLADAKKVSSEAEQKFPTSGAVPTSVPQTHEYAKAPYKLVGEAKKAASAAPITDDVVAGIKARKEFTRKALQ
jgi:hypothetical protein